MGSRLRACIPHGVMLLVAAALYAAASRIETQPGRIGPDFWPKAVIGLMAAMCLFELARRLFGPEPPAAAAAGGDGEPEEPTRWGTLVAGAALIAGFVAAVTVLGFFVSTVLFLAGFAWVGGFRRPGWVVGVSLGGALLMLVLFMRVAYISLPLGEGPFRSFSLALVKLIGVS